MQKVYLLLFFVVASFNLQSQSLDPIWLKQLSSSQSGSGISFDESVDHIEVDSDGNIYVAGLVQRGGFIDTTQIWSIPGDDAAYLAKFNCSGELLWYKLFGDNDRTEPAYSLSVSHDNGRVNLGIGFSTKPSSPYYIDVDTVLNIPNPGDVGALLISYDSSGNLEFFWGTGYFQFTPALPFSYLFSYTSSMGFVENAESVFYGISNTTDTGRINGIPLQFGAYLTKVDENGLLVDFYQLSNERVIGIGEIIWSNNFIYLVNRYPPPFIFGTDTFTTGRSLLAKIDTLGNIIWARSTEMALGGMDVTPGGNLL